MLDKDMQTALPPYGQEGESAEASVVGRELLNLADQVLSGLRGLRLDVERINGRLDAIVAKRQASRALAQVSPLALPTSAGQS